MAQDNDDKNQSSKRQDFARLFEKKVVEVEEIVHEVEQVVEEKAEDVFAPVRKFFQLEASGGILLILAAVFALIIANTDFAGIYNYFLYELNFKIGFIDLNNNVKYALDKPIVLWINDGLMAIFFFLVGMEIKREFREGELSTADRVILPALAAIGGMVVPAGFYFFVNQGNPVSMDGWAIPMATDIAFALGILALLGARAPIALKILLTAIAVIDDLGAVLIIALFYTADVDMRALYVAGGCIIGLFILNRARISKLTPYILFGIIMWVAVLKSGVHATLAGVLTAFFIPLQCPKDMEYSPLKHLEHSLHPWVAFLIIPIFSIANAGVSLEGISIDSLFEPVTLGIFLGLFIGKQLGVFIPLVFAVGLKLSPMPLNTNWMHLYGVSVLCGVGFTMSLFIGGLAFETQEYSDAVKLGVLMASLVSAIVGFLVIRFAPARKDHIIELVQEGEVE